MAQELERPHVTEMHVRMDCNGCVQRIKRALHGVQGIYDVQIDFPQQKLTVVGRATPEKIVKAIKKTRKIATVCSHTEAGAPEPPPPEPAPAAADQPPAETPPADAAPPAEQTKEAPAPEVAGEVKPSPEAAEATVASQPEAPPPTEGKDVAEVHMVYHYPPPHHQVYRQHWDYPGYGYPVQYEAPYSTVIQSYSRYRPSSTTSEYVDLRPPPQSIGYTAEEAYGDGYYCGSGSSGRSNITSMFSDENPNACRIV